MNSDRLVLRPMLRVSKDTSGRECSPDEQLTDLKQDARDEGFELHPQPYREIGSASRYAKKERKDFNKMMKDLEEGTFGADGLALWETSRGSRQVAEWVLLIDMLAARGLKVWAHTHERLYNPARARDRKTLLEDAVASEYEVGLTSERGRRAAREQAKQGRPHGPIPFGWKRIYAVENGKRILVDQVQHPDEAPWVKELFERLLRRHKLYVITQDFALRGLRNRQGNPYGQTHLRKWAINPVHAGWRIHAPEMKGSRRLAPGVARSEGIWSKNRIVSPQDFLVVQEILNNPSRMTRPESADARHWLSMIARCAVCEGYLTVHARNGVERYRCQVAGHVTVNKSALDEFAETYLLDYLGRRDVYKKLRQKGEQADDNLVAVEDDLADARRELQELADQVKARKLSITFAAEVEPELQKRVSGLEQRRQQLLAPALSGGVVEPGPDVLKRWKEAEFSTRRATARRMFSPEWAGDLLVVPSTTRGRYANTPIEDRVEFRLAE